jgi:hypothetical protein
MTIEKRFHRRIDIDADVDIHIIHRDRHLIAKAGNIAPYGILLSTEKLSVPTGMLLELSIDIAGYSGTVPGLVIWSGQQKIGLMFPQIQPALFTAAEAIAAKYPPKNKQLNKSRLASHNATARHILFQPEPHNLA